MDTEEIRATFRFLAQEKKLVSSFGIQDELFLPFLLSLKSGGSWSYASEEAKSVAVKDTFTYYDEASKTGSTMERIYFFVDPVIVNEEGQSAGLKNARQKKKESWLKDLTA